VRSRIFLVLAAVIVLVPWITALYDWPPSERRALVLLMVAAILWATEAIPLFLTGIAVLGVSLAWILPTLQAFDPSITAETFTGAFFSPVILLFLGGFVLSAGLSRAALDRRIAEFVLRRSGGGLPRTTAAVLALTAGLSMWLSNTATAAMMLGIVAPLMSEIPEGDRGRLALLMAVPIGANLGGLVTPVGSPPNAIALAFFPGTPPGFLTWMAMALPATVATAVLGWLLLQLFFSSEATVRLPPETEDPMGMRARSVIVVTGLTVLGWFTGPLHGLHPGVVALLPVLYYFGSGQLGRNDWLRLPWDVLMMMGGGLCLGAVVQTSGLADRLVSGLPADGDTLLVGVIAGAVVLSSVMSNTAAANLLLPLAATFGGASAEALLTAIALSCSVAMALPVSTPPNAMAYASGELRAADWLLVGLPLSAAGGALIWLSAVYWWPLLGIA